MARLQTRATRWMPQATLLMATMLLSLAGCHGGPVRRVSEPSARIQQLTVQADGSWRTELRIENFSSITMRFESVDLGLTLGEQPAGRLTAQPAVTIGPASADIITIDLRPEAAAKLAVADALASGRSVDYKLAGSIEATPDEGKRRTFDVERSSALSPAPGLPGVLR